MKYGIFRPCLIVCRVGGHKQKHEYAESTIIRIEYWNIRISCISKVMEIFDINNAVRGSESKDGSARAENFDLFRELKNFGMCMLSNLKSADLLTFATEIDHACFRVSDLGDYETLKVQLENDAILLSEAFINGRPIASFKLRVPISIGDNFSISVLELPAPKPGKTYHDGFEHIEVVVSDDLENFMKHYPNLKFDKNNLHATTNRDVSLKFDNGLVKFHESSLELVIAREQVALKNAIRQRIVVLDFDDTIVVSKDSFLRAVHVAMEKYFLQTIDFDLILKNARPTFPEFFGNFGITNPSAINEVVKLFRDVWQEEVSNCIIPLGIRSMLSCLKSEGIRVIIWTARDHQTTTDFLAYHQLHHYIEEVFAFNTDDFGKPYPSDRLKKLTANLLGVVIGDSSSDAVGARNLSLPFIQAAWVHKASISGSEVICSTPLEALQILMRLLNGSAEKVF